ncbi:MAG: type II secretion system protein [Phycisphaerae bacterium]|jgi:hypothetical protein|nr:type II secretion system protein [Phycisphaerae bacterium]
MTTRRKGFTLIDLVVVIACIAVLAAGPACMLNRAAEQATRMARIAACQANLNGIGKAVAMYRAEDTNARFPLLFTVGQPESNIEPTHAAGDLEALKTKLKGSEAAMQNVWVLIDRGLVPEIAFECHADKDYVDRKFENRADRKAHKMGWRSSAEFSYGMHFPYKRIMIDDKEVLNPAYLGPQLKGSFVIMADKNPSQNNEPAVGVGSVKSPSNHGDLGEGLLTYSGVVDWKQRDVDSKVNGDDIYTIDTRDNLNPATPANMDDQYIVRHPALPKKQ